MIDVNITAADGGQAGRVFVAAPGGLAVGTLPADVPIY
jgi:hypothetical protein